MTILKSKTSLESSSSPRPCALCTGSYEGYGNNPQPVLEDMNDRVCDSCNWNIVIPARIRVMKMTEYDNAVERQRVLLESREWLENNHKVFMFMD